MACVRADGLRQAVQGERRRERIDQVHQRLVREACPVGFAVMARDQRPEDPQRLRRPGDRGFVDVPAPGRGVIAPGGGSASGGRSRGAVRRVLARVGLLACTALAFGLLLVCDLRHAVRVPVELPLVVDSL